MNEQFRAQAPQYSSASVDGGSGRQAVMAPPQMTSALPPNPPGAQLPPPPPIPNPPAPAGAAAPPGAAPHRVMMSAKGENAGDLDLPAALRAMLRLGGSDLHITSGAPPTMRVDGELVPLQGFDRQLPEGIQRSLYSVLSQKQRETLRGESRARLLLPPRRRGALPRQHLPAARLPRSGVQGHPLRDQAAGGVGPSPRRRNLRDQAARPRARHGPDRLRQVHDARVAHRHGQPSSAPRTS